MRILLVLDQFDGANNGNTNSARRLRDTLIRHGHEVRVAAQGESREGEKYGFPLYHLPVFDKLVTAQGFTFASRDRKTMQEAVEWADVVHVMMPFALSRSAVFEARRQGKPVTGAFHVQPENIWYSSLSPEPSMSSLRTSGIRSTWAIASRSSTSPISVSGSTSSSICITSTARAT